MINISASFVLQQFKSGLICIAKYVPVENLPVSGRVVDGIEMETVFVRAKGAVVAEPSVVRNRE